MKNPLADLMRWLAGIRRPPDRVPFMNTNRRYAAFDVGDWTYGNPTVRAWHEGSRLVIGKYCSIAEGVAIMLGGEHRVDWVTTYPFSVIWPEAGHIRGHPRSKGDIVIGNDVWIGREALILSGITIGNGAVIGARSVVTRDVAAYSIVGGNPARHLKWRFEPDVIAQLERIAWWNWPRSQVVTALPLLLAADVRAFVDRYGRPPGD